MTAEDDPVEAMEVWLQARLEQVHTMLPGRVEKYDADSRLATVKPSVRQRTLHGELLDIPPIAGVPVVWPSSSVFSLYGELEAGDRVMLVFSESSIGSWIKGDGDADAEDETRFSLHDAIAIPGLWPKSKVPTQHDLRSAVWGLASRTLAIGGTEDGKLVVENAITDLRTELNRVFDDINLAHQALFTTFTALAAVAATGIACLTPAGPATPLQTAFTTAAAAETAAQVQVAADKLLLETILK